MHPAPTRPWLSFVTFVFDTELLQTLSLSRYLTWAHHTAGDDLLHKKLQRVLTRALSDEASSPDKFGIMTYLRVRLICRFVGVTWISDLT